MDDGPILTIEPPSEFEPFIANLSAAIRPQVTYTGSRRLSYALDDEPDEMFIDFNSGTITWTPQESDEGEEIDITVHVTDGVLVDRTTFPVSVVEPEEIDTEVIESEADGNKLTVTDIGTTLKGLEITSPPDEEPIATSTLRLLQQILGKAPDESVPEIPEGITPISDVFLVIGTFDNPVELSFPLTNLPDEVSVNDVDLYAHTQAHNIRGKFWSPAFLDYSFEGSTEEPVYVVELAGLEGMAFFGYHSASSTLEVMTQQPVDNHKEVKFKLRSIGADHGAFSVRSPSITVVPPMVSEISCVKETGVLDIVVDYINCTALQFDSDIKVIVKDFPAGTGWADDATVEELAEWVITAQLGLDDLGLGYSKKIAVKIEDMRTILQRILGDDADRLGYVSNSLIERRGTLHITDDSTTSANEIRAILFHEYFHHAQGHGDTRITKVPGPGSVPLKTPLFLLYGDETDWLTEGTAEWFPDELMDTLNLYFAGLPRIGSPIMEVGLYSQQDPRFDERRDAYERFAFFKLLTENCRDFHSHIRNLLNDRSEGLVGEDKTGIVNLSLILAEAECNFGEHFGEARSGSIEAAIAYYNFATQLKDNITLLDEDEHVNRVPFFIFQPSSAYFNLPRTGLPATFPADYFLESELAYLRPERFDEVRMRTVFAPAQVTTIPAVGAFSVKFPEDLHPLANRSLNGKVAELVVEPTGGELIVSLTGLSDGFIPKYPSEPESPENFIGPDPDDEGPEKPDSHAWFSTSDQTSYVFSTTTLPRVFVTVINPSLDTAVDVGIFFRIRSETGVYPVITSHTDGEQVSNRVITIAGSIPEEARDDLTRVVLNANGLKTEPAVGGNGSFEEQVVAFLGDNTITVQGFDDEIPVTETIVLNLEGVASTSTEPNQLVPVRVGFILRWDTDGTDVDIYSTDGMHRTIHFADKVKAPGFLDVDDVSGFGPEVISYRSPNHEIYTYGTFDIDVHYYRGSPSTSFTLDAILNETDSDKRRLYRFESMTPLTDADGLASSGSGGQAGTSRFNNILRIWCDRHSSCLLHSFDESKLASAGETGGSGGQSRTASGGSLLAPHDASSSTPLAVAENSVDGGAFDSYEQCFRELKIAREESSKVVWSCSR